MKALTLTNLRSNLFKIIDQIIESGKPVFIKRKGHIVRIDLDKPTKRTERLFKQPLRKNVITGDPEELVNFKAWQWDENL